MVSDRIKKINPTCGLSSLQKVVQITALIDLGYSIACIIVLSTSFAFFLYLKIDCNWERDSFSVSTSTSDNLGETLFRMTNFDLVLLGLFIVISICFSFLAVYLHNTAKQRNAIRLKIWMFLTILLTGLSLILIFVGSDHFMQPVQGCGIMELLLLIYSVYQMWVVIAFLMEIGNTETSISTSTEFETIPF